MSIIDQAFKTEYQLNNQWDLFFVDSLNADTMHFRVVDTSIPFYKLEVETKLTGEKFYKSLTEIDSVNITIREKIDFSTFTFFENWFNSVYDRKNRVFKVIYNENEEVLRNFNLVFYKPLATALDTALTLGTPFFQNISTPSINPPKPAFTIKLKGCRLVGISDLSLSYDSGGPLTYSVELKPQEIEYVKS